MNLNQLAKKLFPTFLDNAENFEPCCVFLSVSDMKNRAVTRHAVADTPNDAWTSALDNLKAAFGSKKPFILRADWVVKSQTITWAEFLNLLEQTRRNYFRFGIALDRNYNIALTESEINGNALLYKDGKEGSGKCIFRPERFDAYCKIRFSRNFPILEPSSPVEIFITEGAFISEKEQTPTPITGGNRLDAGHRKVSHLNSDTILKMVRNGAGYLAGQVQKSGKFIYGHWPCFDKKVPAYNTLRHFSSAFAMLDVYETYRMGEMKIGSAITRAIKYGASKFIKYRTLDDGSQAAYIYEPDSNEIKLGALGVTLVMLVKHSMLMKTKKYYPLMEGLARAIYTMQKPDGSFVHVLNADNGQRRIPHCLLRRRGGLRHDAPLFLDA